MDNQYLFLVPFFAAGTVFMYQLFGGFHGSFYLHERRMYRKMFRIILVSLIPFLAINIEISLGQIFNKVYNYSYSVTLKEFAGDLNNYSNLIISLLTLVLVISTVIYVLLTNKMVKETKEAQLMDIRPILKLEFNNIEINEGQKISGVINIKNFSKSHILDLELTFKYVSDKIVNFIPVNHGPFYNNPKIDPLASENVGFSELEYSNVEYSFKVKVTYLDVQRNRYEYIAYLSNRSRVASLHIDQETLLMIPYNRSLFQLFSNPRVVIFDNRHKKYEDDF